jgi:hypothetical protein
MKNKAAQQLGSISTPAKAQAARENGQLGGRPNTLTGGKRGFVAAITEAFTSPVSNPTIRYSHSRGFHVESSIHPADEEVIWSALASYSGTGRRSVRPVDYSEIREEIIESN